MEDIPVPRSTRDVDMALANFAFCGGNVSQQRLKDPIDYPIGTPGYGSYLQSLATSLGQCLEFCEASPSRKSLESRIVFCAQDSPRYLQCNGHGQCRGLGCTSIGRGESSHAFARWGSIFSERVLLGDVVHGKSSKHTVFFSGFWLKHHQNLGAQLFLDQFCEDQAYNSVERIHCVLL